MSNTEIAQARLLRIKADTVVKGLGLSRDLKTALLSAINNVNMPLFKYYKESRESIKKSFIKLVLGGLGNGIDDNIKEKIGQCLIKKL